MAHGPTLPQRRNYWTTAQPKTREQPCANSSIGQKTRDGTKSATSPQPSGRAAFQTKAGSTRTPCGFSTELQANRLLNALWTNDLQCAPGLRGSAVDEGSLTS